jgi:hypothetical protein
MNNRFHDCRALLLLAAMALLPPALCGQNEGVTIVPGKGVGPITFGMKQDQIIAKWGKPDEMGLNGRSLNYWSKGILIGMSPSRGVIMIQCVSQLSSGRRAEDCQAKTAQGVGIGTTEQELLKQYGKPTRRSERGETSALHYQDLSAEFLLFQGKITQIILEEATRAKR